MTIPQSREHSGSRPITEVKRRKRYLPANNRPFAGQGHVTMSIIKIRDSTKWLPEMERA